jgi:hypothetical protein
MPTPAAIINSAFPFAGYDGTCTTVTNDKEHNQFTDNETDNEAMYHKSPLISFFVKINLFSHI